MIIRANTATQAKHSNSITIKKKSLRCPIQEDIIKAVLFDVDGTILRSHGAGKQSMMEAASQVFSTTGEMETFNFQGKTDPFILYRSLEMEGFSPEEIDLAIPRFKELYFKILEYNLKNLGAELLPGLMDVLNALDMEPSIICGLLTGNFRGGAMRKLDYFGLFNRFSVGVYGDDTWDRNQMPLIASNRIRDDLGEEVLSSDITIIGDTIYDIECGREFGAKTIAVATGWTDADELKSHNPDFFFHDLSDTNAVMNAIKASIDTIHV